MNLYKLLANFLLFAFISLSSSLILAEYSSAMNFSEEGNIYLSKKIKEKIINNEKEHNKIFMKNLQKKFSKKEICSMADYNIKWSNFEQNFKSLLTSKDIRVKKRREKLLNSLEEKGFLVCEFDYYVKIIHEDVASDSADYYDDFDSDGDYREFYERYINIRFTRKKTNVDINRAKGKIEDLMDRESFDDIWLNFYNVKNKKHFNIIKDIIIDSEISIDNVCVETTNKKIERKWNKLFQRKKESEQDHLYVQEERHRIEQEEFDDFSESQGSHNALLMRNEGYF